MPQCPTLVYRTHPMPKAADIFVLFVLGLGEGAIYSRCNSPSMYSFNWIKSRIKWTWTQRETVYYFQKYFTVNTCVRYNSKFEIANNNNFMQV